MKRLLFPIAAFALMILFSGCGQSGPLYVPGNPSQVTVSPTQQAASEEDEKEKQDPDETSDADYCRLADYGKSNARPRPDRRVIVPVPRLSRAAATH